MVKNNNFEFETTLNWSAGSGSINAIIKVANTGWGKIYDKADGRYCGSLNPIKIKSLLQQIKTTALNNYVF